MTDERIADVCAAIAALPHGSGIVFRHHRTPAAQRHALFVVVRRAATRGRHVLLLAGSPAMAAAWGAAGSLDGSHRRSCGVRAVAVHDAREAAQAASVRADLAFVSPVFATRTHPGAATLGIVRAGLLTSCLSCRTIALGGMTAARARRTAALGFDGWAAIDALSVGRDG